VTAAGRVRLRAVAVVAGLPGPLFAAMGALDQPLVALPGPRGCRSGARACAQRISPVWWPAPGPDSLRSESRQSESGRSESGRSESGRSGSVRSESRGWALPAAIPSQADAKAALFRQEAGGEASTRWAAGSTCVSGRASQERRRAGGSKSSPNRQWSGQAAEDLRSRWRNRAAEAKAKAAARPCEARTARRTVMLP
jgi:hypothetical protein